MPIDIHATIGKVMCMFISLAHLALPDELLAVDLLDLVDESGGGVDGEVSVGVARRDGVGEGRVDAGVLVEGRERRREGDQVHQRLALKEER